MRSSGAELALLLLGGFRALVDALHAELAERGHDDVRPVHGFALQAIAAGADSAADLGRRLDVSKQAAAKTVALLEKRGYVARDVDSRDARRRRLRITERGQALLRDSAVIFDALRTQWADQIGDGQLERLEADLTTLVAPSSPQLDTPGWLADEGRRPQ